MILQNSDQLSNIKSIEFTSDGIIVNKDNSNKFFGYETCEGIKILLISDISYTYNFLFTRPLVVNITLILQDEDIAITSSIRLTQIYQLVDYKRYFKKYNLIACEDTPFEKFIRIYSKYGIKFPIKSRLIANNVVTFSVSMLCIACIIGYGLYTNPDFPLLKETVLIFLIMSSLPLTIIIAQEIFKHKLRKFLGLSISMEQPLDEPFNFREHKILDYENGNPLHPSDINFIRSINPAGVGLLILNIAAYLAFCWFTFLPSLIFQNHDNEIKQLTKIPNTQEIEVNPLSELDGFSKSQIYSSRQHYVSKSIFKSDTYKPNEEVFGNLQDNKYWYGIENLICYDSSKPPLLRTEGPSYVSRLINNPAMLIGVDLPYVWDIQGLKKSYRSCTNGSLLFIPESISYSPEHNLITVRIKSEKRALYNKQYDLKFMFNGLNAKDLGYRWGYVYNKKNIKFINKENAIDKKVYEFRDYLSTGYSCGIKDGCSNLCPMQDRLMFLFQDEKLGKFIGKDAMIDFKLWKEKPLNKLSNPDMYYRIIFEDDKSFYETNS